MARDGMVRPASCRLFGIDLQLQPRDLVTQAQAPLLEAAQHEFVDLHLMAGTVNQRVEVGMFHAKLDQATFRGVEIGIQAGAL
jgi:hypothetical protein